MNRAKKPKVIDLFAGVGGFSLGAVRVGFDLIAAIDIDRHAVAAHGKNFPKSFHARRNILNISGQQLHDLAGLNGERLTGLVGGPPCQGFSTMGKMRKNDTRNKLFFHFFRLVSEIKPVFFVCENVPGILNEKYSALREESFRLVRRDYNVLEPFELSADNFGAPTERTRVFFIGCAKDSGLEFSENDFKPKKQRQKTFVKTAFVGLPRKIDPNWQSEIDGWRKIEKVDSSYTKLINRISVESVGNKDAIERFNNESEVFGFLGTKHTRQVIKRFSVVKPGETDAISKFPRLNWNAACPTLRAGTTKERGGYQAARPIHPSEDRVITTREAARLQSFPDWFLFDSTKWHSFRQIGNSIPPLLAEGVLRPFSCLNT
jgi:DNA (cytosine-5)-methyltransferase 1